MRLSMRCDRRLRQACLPPPMRTGPIASSTLPFVKIGMPGARLQPVPSRHHRAVLVRLLAKALCRHQESQGIDVEILFQTAAEQSEPASLRQVGELFACLWTLVPDPQHSGERLGPNFTPECDLAHKFSLSGRGPKRMKIEGRPGAQRGARRDRIWPRHDVRAYRRRCGRDWLGSTGLPRKFGFCSQWLEPPARDARHCSNV